jgi:hypothetical protein
LKHTVHDDPPSHIFYRKANALLSFAGQYCPGRSAEITLSPPFENSGQLRTILNGESRQQFFRQMRQKPQRILAVSAEIFVKQDGKVASETMHKSPDANFAVSP